MLKRTALIILAIISFMDLGFAANNAFPTLNWQILNNTTENNREQSVLKLKNYLTVMNPEIDKGMKMVLFEKHFAQIMKAEQTNIQLDGYDTEWHNIPNVLSDDAGNTPEPAGDLVLFKCKLDREFNLYTLHKAVKVAPGDVKTYYLVYINFHGGWMRVQYRLDGKNSEYLYNGKWKKIDIKFAVNKVGEAVFPLKKIFNECGIAFPDKLEIRPMIWNQKNGVIKKQRGNRRWEYNDMDFSFDRLYLDVHYKNYALDLLLHLVNNNCYIPGDSITLALALANNVIYSIADMPARQRIKQDTIKHFHFYKKLTEEQKSWQIKYHIQKAPLIPKIYWANRSNTYETENGILTLKYYNEFIDKIEVLEDYYEIAKKNNFHKGYTLRYMAQQVFRFVMSSHKYRSDNIDFLRVRNGGTLPADVQQEYNRGEHQKFYLGKKRYWNEFRWMNYQHNLFQTKGFTMGCCGTYSRVQAVILKSMGIPAHYMYIVIHKINDTQNCLANHLFVKYYNPFFNSWESFNTVNVKKNLDLYLFVYRIKWSHLNNNYENSFFEKTSNEKAYKNLLDKGIENRLIEELFLNNIKTTNRFLFHPANAPDLLSDTDGDDIYDVFEQKFGTHPNNPDTDNDGYSDLWEIEHGFDPLDSHSPRNKKILAIDGLAEKYIALNSIPTINYSHLIKANIRNEKNVIKSLSAKKMGNNIYLAITYFNKIDKSHELKFTIGFQFRYKNIEHKYNIRIMNSGAILYLGSQRKGRLDNIFYKSNQDFEALIPIRIFDFQITELKIVYYYHGHHELSQEINRITVSHPLVMRLN